MTLKASFTSLLDKEKDSGQSLYSKSKHLTTNYELDAIEIQYELWNSLCLNLLKAGLTTSYRHYWEEFSKLDTYLGNVHAGNLENRMKRIRHCLEKKTEYLNWMVSKTRSLPDDAFLPFKKEEIPTKHKDEKMNKVFISHSSIDKLYVGELIDLLRGIGLEQKEIFCTSFEGYSIDLGEDFLSRIKNELGSEVLVLFVLTPNFYKSEVCLCEMGATWVNAKLCIPILIPPFDFKDIKGVFPQTQGLKVNDSSKLNSLKDKIEREFHKTPIHISEWERLRSRFLKSVDTINNPTV